MPAKDYLPAIMYTFKLWLSPKQYQANPIYVLCILVQCVRR